MPHQKQGQSILWLQRLIILSLSLFLFILGRKLSSKSCPTIAQYPTFADLPFPTPKVYRQYHRCHHERIPYVSGVLETAQYLLLTNKSLVRFGDCDITLMMGISFAWQDASTELASRLLTTLTDELPDLAVALPDAFSLYQPFSKPNVNFWYDTKRGFPLRQYMITKANLSRQYFNTGLSTPYVHTYYTYCQLVSETYRILRCVWEGKDIVILRGDNKQVYDYDVYDTARSQVVLYAPRYHAWSQYTQLKSLLLEQPKEKLVILAAGPVSKVLAYDLVKEGRRVLELGHLAKDYNEYRLNRPPPKNFWKD